MAPDVQIDLDLDDYLQRWMFCHFLTDESDYFLISKFLRAGDHFVDVGANIGIVSLIASRAVGPNGKVYAIEALPATRARLETNIELNNAGNIEVIPIALSDRDGSVSFFASTDGNIGGSSLSSQGSKAEAVTVPCRTMATLIADGIIAKCDVMKMDIEGAEILAIKGMTGLFESEPPRAVMIEVVEGLLNQFGASRDDVFAFFEQFGYEWYRSKPAGLLEPIDVRTCKYTDNYWAIMTSRTDPAFFTNE